MKKQFVGTGVEKLQKSLYSKSQSTFKNNKSEINNMTLYDVILQLDKLTKIIRIQPEKGFEKFTSLAELLQSYYSTPNKQNFKFTNNEHIETMLDKFLGIIAKEYPILVSDKLWKLSKENLEKFNLTKEYKNTIECEYDGSYSFTNPPVKRIFESFDAERMIYCAENKKYSKCFDADDECIILYHGIFSIGIKTKKYGAVICTDHYTKEVREVEGYWQVCVDGNEGRQFHYRPFLQAMIPFIADQNGNICSFEDIFRCGWTGFLSTNENINEVCTKNKTPHDIMVEYRDNSKVPECFSYTSKGVVERESHPTRLSNINIDETSSKFDVGFLKLLVESLKNINLTFDHLSVSHKGDIEKIY